MTGGVVFRTKSSLRSSFDNALVFAMLARLSQAAAGLGTVFLVGKFFSPVEQGYYYAFASILALQVFVELGLSIVIVSLASHQWSLLYIKVDGSIGGDSAALSRLSSLLRFSMRWYSTICLVFAVFAGAFGVVFFNIGETPTTNWQGPWTIAIVLTAIQLWLGPILAVIEGCDQVARINRFRLLQVVSECAVAWPLLVVGAGLWIVPVIALVRLISTCILLVSGFRPFLDSMRLVNLNDRLSWRNDIWPMQWRLAAQGVVNYFTNFIFVPVIFYFHGPVVAGQFGMGLQVVLASTSLALVWVQVKAPHFGALVARGDFFALNKSWRLATFFTLVQTILSYIFILLLVKAIEVKEFWLRDRLPESLTIVLLMMGYLALQVTNCQAVYLRAHAREPFLALGVSSGIMMGSAVILLGSRFGGVGAAGGLCAVAVLFTLPYALFIFRRRRLEWQSIL